MAVQVGIERPYRGPRPVIAEQLLADEVDQRRQDQDAESAERREYERLSP